MSAKVVIDQKFPDPNQPKGTRYFTHTVSGLIILLNSVIFAAMTWRSFVDPLTGEFMFEWQHLFVPPHDVIIGFGSASPLHIAQGEFWRFVTPIFIHIGFIHFFLNNLGLYYIGFQIERSLGRTRFLILYLVAGIFGNIASINYGLRVSAGASGAIFGLLGCGYLIEKVVGRHLSTTQGVVVRSGVYGSMLFLNIALGFVIPVIDNAAHIGGLVAGLCTTYYFFSKQGSVFVRARPLVGRFVLSLLLLVSCIGMVLASDQDFVQSRFEHKAIPLVDELAKSNEKIATLAPDAYHLLSQALVLDPSRQELWFQRGRLFVLVGDQNSALKDFRVLVNSIDYKDRIAQLVAQAKSQGIDTWQIERYLKHAGSL